MVKRIETRFEVQTYIDKLRYAIIENKTVLKFQRFRRIDAQRDFRFTNAYTMDTLFPDKIVEDVIKETLLSLELSNDIQTVQDIRFPKRSEMRVFGKCIQNQDVYIKLRVELISQISLCVSSQVLVLSFHFSDIPFQYVTFPYRD